MTAGRKPSARGAQDPERRAREKRLAEALRANLKRRKASERGPVPAPDAKQPTK